MVWVEVSGLGFSFLLGLASSTVVRGYDEPRRPPLTRTERTVDFPVKSIGVVGNGVVGSAVAASYLGFCDVRCFDALPERRTHDYHRTMLCDLVFVCLPTPQEEGGLACDTSALVEFFETMPEEYRCQSLVLRSTVPIGFTRDTARLMRCPNLVHSPEFLTARTAIEDAANPRVNVIGVPGWTTGVDEVINPCADVLCDVYESRFIDTDVLPTRVMSSDESEAVKLTQNAFSAVKIAFFNEVHALLQKKGCDYGVVREALLAQGWVNPMHTQVPGPDGKMGFGGSCLPPGFTLQLEDGSMVPIERAAPGVNILSTDAACRETEYKTVSDVTMRRYVGDLVELTVEGKVFKCTSDHLMPVMRDLRLRVVRAADVVPTDNLLVNDDGR